jgi:serine/threonine protein kinase
MGSTSYTFVRCLGRGGFGEVYLATRRSAEGIERKVAVKVLRTEPHGRGGFSEQAVARMRDEARLLAILAHPAIVAAFELTRLHGRIALVTEYVDGTDLTSFCVPSHRLPVKVLLSIMGEVAGALDCAYTTLSPETGKPLHLVHRDVKPENIRLSRFGEAKLLDFGIARSSEVMREARTGTGTVPFTPGYTAPEAFVALRQEPATDVFALGATLFRLLAGERYYERIKLADQAALSSHPDQYDKYLAGRLRRVPNDNRDLVELLRDCLSYDPSHRPTAADLQLRSETLAEALPGPTARRWARETAFPSERGVEGGDLLGHTLSEDNPGDSIVFDRPTVQMPRPKHSRPVERHPERHLERSERSQEPARPAPVAPFPWIALTFGFLSLGLGAVILAIAAFAAGFVVGG